MSVMAAIKANNRTGYHLHLWTIYTKYGLFLEQMSLSCINQARQAPKNIVPGMFTAAAAAKSGVMGARNNKHLR